MKTSIKVCYNKIKAKEFGATVKEFTDKYNNPIVDGKVMTIDEYGEFIKSHFPPLDGYSIFITLEE